MNNNFTQLKQAAYEYRTNPNPGTAAAFTREATLTNVEKMLALIAADQWIAIDDHLPPTDPLPDGSIPMVLVVWRPETRASNITTIDVSNTEYLAINAQKALYWKTIIPPNY